MKWVRLLSNQNAGFEDEILYLVDEAQKGDSEAREFLIKKYTPFILKTASKSCGKYISLGQDDESSIGLLAFNEAIDSFKKDNGGSFLSFAQIVIKRRLIDFFRKEKREEKVIPLSFYKDTEDFEANTFEWTIEGKSAVESFSKSEEAEARKQEIFHYNQILKDFGLSFAELVEVSPKHQDARINAIKVAKLIAEQPSLRSSVLEKKTLPLKEIASQVDISRKTIERNRKYIIAVFLILVNDLMFLKEYLKAI